jgi:predicted N-formylglutamate amidohydrolase
LIVLSCEHGGNRTPPDFRSLFRPYSKLLATHRGYDVGALALAKRLAAATRSPLHFATVTRLLVDLNRSIGHPNLFSEIARPLDRPALEQVLLRHYHPYRRAVQDDVASRVDAFGRVLHLSVHTFTPVLAGVVRTADVGLLYDPKRPAERDFCLRWRDAILRRRPSLRVRRNSPYRGVADGLVSHLRKRFPSDAYVGVELEVNQRFPLRGGRAWTDLQRLLADALRDALAQSGFKTLPVPSPPPSKARLQGFANSM